MVTAALHPAARRKALAQMPEQPAHEVRLRPLGGGDARTVIATCAAQDFIEALFEDLQARDWKERISRMRRLRKGDDNVLELGLPTHRRFHLALFEAFCVRPGEPRLDPAKICGAGLVLRRVQGQQRKAWYKQGKTILGWRTVNLRDADPDPAKAAIHPANAALRQAIAAKRGQTGPQPAESVHGLYRAPPEVCAAIGRTVLFAVIPVASGEREDRKPDPLDYNALGSNDRREMVTHFSEYLKDRSERKLPRRGEVLSKDWNVTSAETLVADPQLSSIGTFLYQMMAELDALGSGTAAGKLMQVLAEIRLPTAEDQFGRATATQDAASFVRQAAPILIGGADNPQNFRMPLRWPEVGTALGDRLVNAALACLSEQHAARVGSPEKFRDDHTQYTVRGFIRVAGHDGCPNSLIWSIESEKFRILPWWDGDGPGTTISLPDLSKLKKVKPSVAFAMPAELANLLNRDVKKLVEGKGNTSGPGIDWLCSFSIPSITICAFIVLNIFLSMFDLILRWMLFIKLCIPIPKR